MSLTRPSRRAMRDAEIVTLIEAEGSTRFGSRFGARKMWLGYAAKAATWPAAPSNG